MTPFADSTVEQDALDYLEIDVTPAISRFEKMSR